jgi:hypothetical protein
MASLIPSSTEKIVTSEAPQQKLSGGEIAQPYEMLAKGLDSLGEGLDKVAVPLAEQAGMKSVSLDDQGNLQVSHAPIVGDAGAAYARAQKFSALAQGQAAAKRADFDISAKYPNDPKGYLEEAQKFRQKLVDQYSQVSPEVGMALGKSIDDQTSYNYRFLLLQQQRTIRDNFDSNTKAQIKSHADDIESLLQTGAADTPAGRKVISDKFNEVQRLYHERINNPVLAAPKEQAAYEIKQLDERIGAGKFVSTVNKILDNPKGGIGLANDLVEGVLNDETLSPNQRTINYAHGLAAIKEHEQNLTRETSIRDKVQKQKDQMFENAVIQGTAGQGPRVFENDIKTAQDISPESKMRMLSWVRRDGMPEPPSHISQAASTDLFRRMNLPDTDPQRISDLGPIREAYAPTDGSKGKLTRADEEWLEKRFTESRTPEGERLTQVRQQFTHAVEPTIDKSNPLLGKIDQSGKLQAYAFQRFVDQKVDEYRKAGKSPYDLFDPGKADYLGKPETLRQFSVPISQSIKNIRENLGGQVTPSSAPAVPQRQPGESVTDFLKRTGG